MSSVEQLNTFLARVTSDEKLTTTHIGVCTALAVSWMKNGFCNRFSISRSKMMTAARIKSTATYHKVMSDLVKLKYFEYYPSYHPGKGSGVHILGPYDCADSNLLIRSKY